MAKTRKELVADHFPLFSRRFNVDDKLCYQLAQQIKFYCKDKLEGTAEERKEVFFGQVTRDTGEKRPDNSRTAGGTSARTYESYVSHIRANKADSTYVLLLFYWFHLFPEDNKFARAIDQVVFSANRYKGEKTYEAQFEEDIPGKKEIWRLLRRGFVRSPHAEIAGEEKEPDSALVDVSGKSVQDEAKAAQVHQHLIKHSIWQPPEYHPQTKFSEDEWLSPANPHGIPFVERDDEMAQLNAFAGYEEGKPDFKMWALIAPSGAGKTRLMMEWLRNSDAIKGWRKSILKKRHLEKEAEWNAWQPDRPTLLVIDYIAGFEGLIRKLVYRFIDEQAALAFPVRLLVLDHVFPEQVSDIDSYPRWGLDGISSETTRDVEGLFFKAEPLLLDKAADLDRVIHGVIAKVAGCSEDDQRVAEAADYLRGEKGAWRPLFAALAGDAIRKGADAAEYRKWNRRELMTEFLKGEDRLPWLRRNDGEPVAKNVWASAFMTIATLRGGVQSRWLAAHLPARGPLSAANKKDTLGVCQALLPKDDSFDLGPFLPDILGENFALLFLSDCFDGIMGPQDKASFLAMLCAGTKSSHTAAAESFAAILQRFARNLSNDEQTKRETDEHWNALLDLLAPQHFADDGAFRWAAAYASFEISRLLREKELNERADEFLDQVEAGHIYAPPPGISGPENLIAAIRHFEETRGDEETIPEPLKAVLTSHDPINTEWHNTSLMIASSVGSMPITKWLIECGASLDASNKADWTALMIACAQKQGAVALELIARGASLDASNKDDWTALMLACYYEQEAVALALIARGASLDASNNKEVTALMFACLYEQEAVALELIARGASLDASSKDDWTALMLACDQKQEAVALELIARGASLDASNNDEVTALMFACVQKQEAVALELIARGASLDASNNDGWTALMLACDQKQEAVALELIARGATVNTSSDDGQTVLMTACLHSLESVALTLLEKGADPVAISEDGGTVLMHACFGDLENIVRLLIEKEVPLNEVWDGVSYPATALGLARVGDNQEIVMMLEEAGALELPPYSPKA